MFYQVTQFFHCICCGIEYEYRGKYICETGCGVKHYVHKKIQTHKQQDFLFDTAASVVIRHKHVLNTDRVLTAVLNAKRNSVKTVLMQVM